MIARYARPVASAMVRRASSAVRSDTATWSAAWFRSALLTGASSGTVSPAVDSVCVRGVMLLPSNDVTGSITLVENDASTDGSERERTCCRIDWARRTPAAACCTVGWLVTARRTASSNVTRSSSCAATDAGRRNTSAASACRGALRMGGLRAARFSGDERADDHVENRDEHDVEEGREQHAAGDRGPDRMA